MENEEIKKDKKITKQSNKKGRIPMCIGAILILCAILLSTYNIIDNKRAENAAKKALELLQFNQSPITSQDDFTPDYILNPNMDLPTQTIENSKYVGVLYLPTLNLTLPVIDTCDNSGLRKAPCRYTGTPYLKNMIIAAHNYTRYFAKIGQLKYEDEVSFKDLDGNVFKYKVQEIVTIKENDVEGMKSGDWDLTLFTCNYSGRARVTIRRAQTEEIPCK